MLIIEIQIKIWMDRSFTSLAVNKAKAFGSDSGSEMNIIKKVCTISLSKLVKIICSPLWHAILCFSARDMMKRSPGREIWVCACLSLSERYPRQEQTKSMTRFHWLLWQIFKELRSQRHENSVTNQFETVFNDGLIPEHLSTQHKIPACYPFEHDSSTSVSYA